MNPVMTYLQNRGREVSTPIGVAGLVAAAIARMKWPDQSANIAEIVMGGGVLLAALPEWWRKRGGANGGA